QLTITGMLMGTANYMAPEQARNAKAADVRSDIYSLGCTLFFLINGRPVYSADSVANTVLAHAHDPIPLLSDSTDDPLLIGLNGIFQRMVAKQPGDRFSTMEEVIAALNPLRQIQTDEPPQPRPIALPIQTDESHWKRVRRKHLDKQTSWWNFLLSGVGVLGLSILLWVVINRERSTTHKADRPGNSPKNPNENSLTISKRDYELEFNGTSSYVAVPQFRMELNQPHTFETIVTVDEYRVSNILSYIGPEWMALFIGGNQQWGVAQRRDGRSNLILSRQRVEIGKRYHLAGVWNGQSLALFINGELADVVPFEYELPETEPGLFIGGMPPERLPATQNDRFFAGRIDSVRISGAVRYESSFQPPTRLSNDVHTLALYNFDEGTGDIASDDSRWKNSATIHQANWFPR
ncbi:MAG: hypothetical protein KDA84_12555, partial [Planctomycetaceae bacterium]|nr:hypothetical protein [Planctomycetaceae bacterium]